MRKFGSMWPTLKRLLAYGSPWRKPLSVNREICHPAPCVGVGLVATVVSELLRAMFIRVEKRLKVPSGRFFDVQSRVLTFLQACA